MSAALLFAVGLLIFIGSCARTTSPAMLTYHNDNLRTGQNLGETVLTPQNVNSGSFGKLFSYATDGAIYAQPLYAGSLHMSDLGVRNVVYVVTEHDSVYAFDANQKAPGTLWHVSLLGSGSDATPVPCADERTACDYFGAEIGITSTPVIDIQTATLYVCAFTKEGGTYIHRLHALDLVTGSEKFGGPVVIQASVAGKGVGGDTAHVPFVAYGHLQRCALLLANGVVYVAFASFADIPPYHGWLFGYDAATLRQRAVLNLTPDGEKGGIWQSGNGPATDSTGDIYLVTGNGTFNANAGGHDFGDSFVRIKPGNGSVSVIDFFTPFNQESLRANDVDLGAGGPLLLPDQGGAHPHLMLTGGKEGTLYLVNRDHMGRVRSGDNDQIVQSLVNIGPIFCTPAFWENKVYIAGVRESLKVYNLIDGMLSPTPASQSPNVFGFPGGTPTISANGAQNGIAWVLENAAFRTTLPAVLHAYDATDVSRELYNSEQAGGRDSLPHGVGFGVPTVVNGRVFVGTLTELAAFGPLPH